MSDLVMQIRVLEAAVDRVRRLHGQYDTSGLEPGKWCPTCGREGALPNCQRPQRADRGEAPCMTTGPRSAQKAHPAWHRSGPR